MDKVSTYKLHHYMEQTQEGILSQILPTKQNNSVEKLHNYI